MNKVLIICGQTATGKTDLAYKLAKKFNGEIISADSRQVYRGMDIGTGKEIPDKNIPTYGLDLVNPDQEFSVSQYRKYARERIDQIISRDHLTIVVGGTGFYIDYIFKNQDLLDIPKDEDLRSQLAVNSAEELFNILKKLDLDFAESLNNSEKHNKQRLIRRIEIAKSKSNNQKNTVQNNFDCLYIGLKLDKSSLKQNIEKRIKKRIDDGFENELNNLIKKYGNLDIFKNTPGYKDWPDVDKWLLSETQYAKRQMTWFKKNENIKWFDASLPSLMANVEEVVSKWYSKSNAKKD